MPCCVNPRTRTNGYDCPNDPLQLTSWVLILLFAVTFFGLWVPQLSSVAEQAATSAVYGTVLLLTLCSAHRTASADPRDDYEVGSSAAPCAWKHLERPRDEGFDYGANRHCYICNAVRASRTQHCPTCRKCVAVFDHHCKWLNTCVGAVNYTTFLHTIWATSILMVIQLGAGINAIGEYHGWWGGTGGADVRRSKAGRTLGGGNGWIALSWVCVVLAAVVLYMVMELVLLHRMLCRRGITTYEYSVKVLWPAEQEKQREKQAQRAAARHKRQQEREAKAEAAAEKAAHKSKNANVDPTGAGVVVATPSPAVAEDDAIFES